MTRWLILAGLVIAVGCGSGNDDDDGSDTPAGGSSVGGSASEGGDATAGGDGAQGGAGATTTGTGGVQAVPGMCSPVQRVDPPSVDCPGWNTRPVGIPLDTPGVTVTSVALPTTIVPGNAFAVSLVTETGEADVQLWGTNEECGESFEAFPAVAGSTVHLTPGVQCWNVLATSPHSHVLIIRQASTDYVSGELVTCALGAC